MALQNTTKDGMIMATTGKEVQYIPVWLLKFCRRVLSLDDGRYTIVLTKSDGQQDWTVQRLGKVEQ